MMYYNRRGESISLEEWCAAFEAERHVAEDILFGGRIRVSTVWLGLDHNFGRNGPPLIFETMAFLDAADQSESVEMQRYATLAEAAKGHKEMVAYCAKKYAHLEKHWKPSE